MIQAIIENTVGKDANIVFVLCKESVKKYVDLDYTGLEFTDDLAGYFEPNEHGPQRKIDLVLIDANNEFKVVKKALVFALKKVGKNGAVVLANSLPPNRIRYVTPQRRPGNWYGEVWKVVSGLANSKSTDFVTYACGNGYSIVVNRENSILSEEPTGPITLQQYADNRKVHARLVSALELREWYDNRETEGSDTQTS